MRKAISASILLLTLVSLFWLPQSGLTQEALPDLAGNYTVQGWQPGDDFGGPAVYGGSAVISAFGDGYRFTATLDGEIFEGAALLDKERGVLAMEFGGPDEARGVTLLRLDQGVLRGFWMNSEGDGRIGQEIWLPTK